MKCSIYSSGSPSILLIEAIDRFQMDSLETQISLLNRHISDYFVAFFAIEHWNDDLSPWPMEPVFGRDGFQGNAASTLRLLLPEIERVKTEHRLPLDIPTVLGGYSLAGLFALWAATKHPFAAINAASPSVWFRHWNDYASAQTFLSPIVYLSVGDKEGKAKNKTLATVDMNLEALTQTLQDQDVDVLLEINPGNHFQDADLRTAKGFIWCVNALRER